MLFPEVLSPVQVFIQMKKKDVVLHVMYFLVRTKFMRLSIKGISLCGQK